MTVHLFPVTQRLEVVSESLFGWDQDGNVDVDVGNENEKTQKISEATLRACSYTKERVDEALGVVHNASEEEDEGKVLFPISRWRWMGERKRLDVVERERYRHT